jgi:poly(3-hydroxybutyrate) depolymerase
LLYNLHEFNRALLRPATHLAQAGASMFSSRGSWLAHLPGAGPFAAGCELFYRLGKDYEKPRFDIQSVQVRDNEVSVIEQTEMSLPFCRLQRFKRYSDRADVLAGLKRDPVVLVVAPLSGHHATLVRDTVRTLLGQHKVYVTDWVDARVVPQAQGSFGLDDYVAYLRAFIGHIGAERLHLVSVCQAIVPAVAAVALGAAAGEPQPRSLVLIGGPLDTRRHPTAVNRLATTKSLSWFEKTLLHQVPSNYPGRGRKVYPGFLQHAGFISMNPMRHMTSHWDFFQDLVRGDMSDAAEHRRFYDEYNAVLDMPAEYYLDCIRVVFQQHLLPRGQWYVGQQRVAPEAITGSALMTIEGELDDISGPGQTQAAHEMCAGIPAERKHHLTLEGAGHYGTFSGRRWRETVYPQVRDFIAAAQRRPARQRRPK